MDEERIASALEEALKRDGEVDPDAFLAGLPDDDVPESFLDLEARKASSPANLPRSSGTGASRVRPLVSMRSD